MSLFRLPSVMAHRGASAYAPENTLESLREAARRGAACVEFDTKLTADGVVILFHDETLERTTDGRGRVAETAYGAIRALDAGAWFAPAFARTRVPTLKEAIQCLVENGLLANIEIKPCPGREEETALAVLDVLARSWPKGRPSPILTSFRPASLAVAGRVRPEIARGLLVWDHPKDWGEVAAAQGCVSVACADRFITREWAQEIRRSGYALGIYTVNAPERARELRGWGVDCLITDRPDAILAAAPA